MRCHDTCLKCQDDIDIWSPFLLLLPPVPPGTRLWEERTPEQGVGGKLGQDIPG